MGILGFFLGALTIAMLYWLFIKEQSHKKWYTCILAIVFTAFTVFALDFVLTTAIEGLMQATIVAAVFFGMSDAVLFVLWRRFTSVSNKPGAITITKEG